MISTAHLDERKETTSPTLVVLTFFYNRAEVALKSVRSVLDALPANSLLIVVDDGSSDNLAASLQELEEDQRLVVKHQQNLGFTASLSKWTSEYIDKLNPTYIAIHGSGDKAHPEKFRKQIEYLENNLRAVAVGTSHRLIAGHSGAVVSSKESKSDRKLDLTKTVPFTHGSVLYRSADFAAVGGYDTFFKYCQDWELYTRLCKRGDLHCLPDVLYDRYVMPDGVSQSTATKWKQLVYRDCAVAAAKDQELYLEKKRQIEELGVEAVAFSPEAVRSYLGAQFTQILLGDFKTALDWTDLLRARIPRLRFSQTVLAGFLRLGRVTRCNLLVSSTYRAYRLMKSQFKRKPAQS